MVIAVPVMKHGFGPEFDSKYFRDPHSIYWTVIRLHLSKFYYFKTRSWSYLD